MGLGGPVWHASVAGKFAAKLRRRLAFEALNGVGVPELQWEDNRPKAYHIRRRLTYEEQREFGVYVCDMRGTVEGAQRFVEAKAKIPRALWHWAAQEIVAP